MPLSSRRQLLKTYHAWDNAKRTKYDRVISLKYGPMFLKKLKRSVVHEGHSNPTYPKRRSPTSFHASIKWRSSSTSDQLTLGSLTDTEILAPTTNQLPEELFSTESTTSTCRKEQSQDEASDKVASPLSRKSLIKEDEDQQDILAEDREVMQNDGNQDPPEILRKVTNRRKKNVPQKHLKKSKTLMKERYYESVEKNLKKLRALSLGNEGDMVELQGGFQNTPGGKEIVKDPNQTEEMNNDVEARNGFGKTEEYESRTVNNISIPRRKTARKKISGIPTESLMVLQRVQSDHVLMTPGESDKDIAWKTLREKVLTNQSPSLKVVCTQLKSPELYLQEADVSVTNQEEKIVDTMGEGQRSERKSENVKSMDGKDIKTKDEKNKGDEENIGQTVQEGFELEKSTPTEHSIRTKAELYIGDKTNQSIMTESQSLKESKWKVEEIKKITEEKGNLHVTNQLSDENCRTTLWRGNLRRIPKKCKPYQVTPSVTIKKKLDSEQPSSVRTSLKTGNHKTQTTSQSVQKYNNEPKFLLGQLVWGHMKGFPWWPGKIVHHYAMKRRNPPADGYVTVQWLGDLKFSQLKMAHVKSFEHFNDCLNLTYLQKRNLYKKALFEALKLAAAQTQKAFIGSATEYPGKDSSDEKKKIFEETFSEMKAWANDGFEPSGHKGLIPLPEDTKEPPSPPTTPVRSSGTSSADTTWEDTRGERMSELKKGEISLEEFCLACGSKSIITEEHPLFVGGLCEVCRVEYLETAYMFADDGYQCYCCVCAEGKELVLCENKGCYRSYCTTCMNLLIDHNELKRVMTQDPWICYMCQRGESFGNLKIQDDWPRRLHEFFSRDQSLEFAPLPTWAPKPLNERKPIRVLSLFDGIGTGMHVLRELGIVVDVYVASEINTDAIKVSSVRQKGAITQLGDVKQITTKQLEEYGPFDLLIGGSPCNDLSMVNPARKGIYGGTGLLFFEFVRILYELQMASSPDRPLFWFFENVVFMGHEDKMTINRFLKCNPVMVDAKDLSPAHRARYFWGNLPGMSRPSAALVDSPLKLQDCLEQHCNRQAKFAKVRTVTTKANSIKQCKEAVLPVQMDGKEDGLWCTELERLFGFPEHYTDVCNLSRGGRQSLLGQCWSVPVIHHLLAPLKDYFQCK